MRSLGLDGGRARSTTAARRRRCGCSTAPSLTLGAGEVVGAGRAVGRGQVDAAARRGAARRRRRRDGAAARAGGAGLDDAARTRLRREAVGFVYQFHHLLPEFSALENVALPQRAAGRRARAGRGAGAGAARGGRARGTGWRTGRRSCRAASSSGWRWRGRSPTGRALLLADEPTGNLDPETSGRVFGAAARAGARDRAGGADRHPQPRARRADGPGAAARGRAAGAGRLIGRSGACRAARQGARNPCKLVNFWALLNDFKLLDTCPHVDTRTGARHRPPRARRGRDRSAAVRPAVGACGQPQASGEARRERRRAAGRPRPAAPAAGAGARRRRGAGSMPAAARRASAAAAPAESGGAASASVARASAASLRWPVSR